MGLMEAIHHVYTSAVHIPGVENDWPDAGSRMWFSSEALLKFSELSRGYVQVEVEEPWRNPLDAWQSFCNTQLLPSQVRSSIAKVGSSGVAGVQ